jgi:hypothetical protein
MASQFHHNEVFLYSLTSEQIEQLRQEAENLSKKHKSALIEQLQRLNIK